MTLDLLQWPAMVVTVLAGWLVASSSQARRKWGFWIFLLSNALWIAWGAVTHAYALVLLQVCLAFMNIRGTRKNDDAQANDHALQPDAKAARWGSQRSTTPY